MRYSTRIRYGLRFLVNLASRPPDSCVQLAEIARCEGISVKYLEQIASVLRPAGLLRSVRGSKGGYALALPPEEIALEPLFLLLEGHIAPVDCLNRPCSRQEDCSARVFWQELDAHLRTFLRQKTLASLVTA